ncbi:hypothetical protein [Crassaminicella indica]|uniref:Uncharacterized protein n=1 Tax=Crassaminicella indica TaxID=2855394 RepID=A0ABX8RCP6_9CLOT|nr:hypothetical protein [Crassaminicella indica]QXM06829.1 hypothetical protein KVH43_03655 [Crassaminicella indica]
MNQSYVDKFNIIQTLQTNTDQNIFMGSLKDHPEELVTINILHNIKSIRTYMGKFKKALKTLKHIEKLDGDLVVVTKTQEGIPLEAYLEEENINVENRLSMVFQYLKNIKRYDVLEHGFKNNLINESQIVVQKGRLSLNELLIIDKLFTNIDDFQQVAKEVGRVVKKILLYPILDEADQKNIDENILKFVYELERGKREYKNLEEIYNDFKGLYLYNERKANTKIRGKNYLRLFSKVTIGLVIIAIGTLAYANFMHQWFIGRKADDSPTAYFEKIKMKNQWQFINKSKGEGIKKYIWEVRKGNKTVKTYSVKDLIVDIKEPGEYNIVLKVQDQKNQWSKEYIEKVNITKPQENEKIEEAVYIPSDEKLESLNIVYEDNIIKDYDLFRNGEYSIKVAKMKDEENAICIKDLKLDISNVMSMWLMSDATEPVQIKIEAYKNEKLRFTKSVVYEPSKVNTWDLLRIDDDMEQVDEVKIIILNDASMVWLDDIEFATYK